MNRLRSQYRGARPSSQSNLTLQPPQTDEPMDELMEVDSEYEVEQMEWQPGYYFLLNLKLVWRITFFLEDSPEVSISMWIPEASEFMEWESSVSNDPEHDINGAHLIIRNLSLVLGYDDCKYKL